LQMRDVSCSADGANPFVVTLAAPFIEIHQTNFGARPLIMRIALLFVMFAVGFVFPRFLFPSLPHEYVSSVKTIVLFSVILMGWWWIFRRANTRQTKLDTLKNVTRLGEISGERLFVIRAIDDEASLWMALGTIVNHSMANIIAYIFLIFCSSGYLILRSSP
jgi:hypothetical protein